MPGGTSTRSDYFRKPQVCSSAAAKGWLMIVQVSEGSTFHPQCCEGTTVHADRTSRRLHCHACGAD
eukprot:14358130-Alexandrium_andersonii.AAC.1